MATTETQKEVWHAVAQIEQSALGLGLLIGEISNLVSSPPTPVHPVLDLAARIAELVDEYLAFQVLLKRYLTVVKGLAA